MRQLVAELADTPHRYVVSMGPQHAAYELADNMVGEEFLPQTSVLPHVDAVITHGGNNTTTECMWFGKPMLVLPIFWDQHDNAQRIAETGYGVRLPTYEFADGELARLSTTCFRTPRSAQGVPRRESDFGERPGTTLAADLIEGLASS